MFERLPTIPTSQELIDKAFRRASRAKDDESKVQIAGNILSDNLVNLVRKFPSFENVPPFYREMADIIAGVDEMRVSLSHLHWASRQIRKISREFVTRIKRSRRSQDQNSALQRRAAFGRISSIMRAIEKDLLFLNEARNRLRKLPAINPAQPTILIAGYPNVGKSSFIILVTDARPEIASYPFTTREIHVGHFQRGEQRYQVVDTPGLLDRPLSERNEIERQALAAMSHLSGVILFILDPSEHCGYPLESQLRLMEDLRGWIRLPVLVVANKTDLRRYAGLPEMSTATGQGVKEVQDMLVSLLQSSPEKSGETEPKLSA
jgi:nucleolar GTP-binding protein